MDTGDDVEQATTRALDAVHRITDQMLGPEIAHAVLLGIAATMSSGTWAEAGFAWRMVRLSS